MRKITFPRVQVCELLSNTQALQTFKLHFVAQENSSLIFEYFATVLDIQSLLETGLNV